MIPDERLGLVFACCHPALALEAQVPLTLRLVGGLTVPEIAAGAARCPRRRSPSGSCARSKKVRLSGIPLAEPPPDALAGPARAPCSPCSTSSSPRATRPPPATRSSARTSPPRRSGSPRVVHALLPDEPEPAGLLALMLLQHARRAARRRRATASSCCSRSRTARRWDRGAIAQALPLVDRALTLRRPPGPYALQAAIAARPRAGAARRGDRLAPDRAALRRARARAAQPGRRAQPRRRGGDGRRPGGGAGADRPARAARSTTTTCCTPRARTCCAAQGRRDEAAAAYRRALELATNAAERRFLARAAGERAAAS